MRQLRFTVVMNKIGKLVMETVSKFCVRRATTYRTPRNPSELYSYGCSLLDINSTVYSLWHVD